MILMNKLIQKDNANSLTLDARYDRMRWKHFDRNFWHEDRNNFKQQRKSVQL